jgi:hypothetical protein
LAIEFSKQNCRWRIIGAAAEIHISEQRAKIIVALKETMTPMKIGALMEATNMQRNPLEVLLGRMVTGDEIQRLGKGLYAHKDYVPPQNLPANNGKRDHLDSKVPTDGATDASSTQTLENDQQNISICPSVASVSESTDPGLMGGFENAGQVSVPTQTDRTGGQTATEGTDTSDQFPPTDLSGNLSVGAKVPATRLLRREFCTYCRRGPGINNPVEFWKYEGREVSLHQRCLEPWADRERRAERDQASQ